MKKYFYLLAATAFMASCSNEDFVGEAPASAPQAGKSGAIEFAGFTPNRVRAGGQEAAGKLSNQFFVYGIKTTTEGPVNVFAQNALDATSNTPFFVWYNGQAHSTESNTAGWEYVASANTTITPVTGGNSYDIAAQQEIKYWDQAASSYSFIAYSAPSIVSPAVTNVTINGFNIAKANAATMANFFIAERKNEMAIPSLTEGTDAVPVQFQFRSIGAKVRLGIYENIAGYQVRNVKFTAAGAAVDGKAALDGTFFSEAAYQVGYDASQIPTVTKTEETIANTLEFGSFDNTATIGTTATAPTWAGGNADAYINVLPNNVAGEYAAMTLTVDFQLYNETTGETIDVTGAQAVVPTEYMKWMPNYAYTYLFKFTDKANNLWPITFDAVTIETVESEFNEGTITTIYNPYITTYQEGSVVAEGIKYTAGTDIVVTVEDGASVTLTEANFSISKYTSETYDVATLTEADLLVETTMNQLTSTAITSTLSGNQATFNPAEAGTYAVKYTYTADGDQKEAYKVIVVE